MSHNADDIVGTVHPEVPGANVTRLESAELERRNAIRAELDRHRDNLDAELSRHRREMDNIAIHFGRQMNVA